MKNLLLAFFFLGSTQTSIYGQEENFYQGTFRFYTSGGLNVSHITEDSLGGFKKWGLIGGIGGFVMLSDFISTSIEINYTMRGARGFVFDEDNRTQLYHRFIGTEYLEAPVFVSYHDRGRASIGAGIVAAALLNSSQARNWKNIDESTNLKFNPIDIGFLINGTLYFGRKIALNLRFTHSLIPTNEKSIFYGNQYHNVLSTRFMYIF